MTLTLRDVIIFLGLCIDGHVVTSTSVHNWIALCECAFGLHPLLLN
jgi:hypothetical protein